ncbi:MAG: hypothetical protein PVI23_16655, partial [Maricaulaceae bacterium]
TILRPPDKTTPTVLDELSLISFPTRELFQQTIDEFDLIIFDLYKHRRDVIESIYLTNIAQYVEDGGALLIAAGPPFVTELSLFNTSLAAILPARPTNAIFEGGFRPSLTERGRRHPVTATLQGAQSDEWGRWFRVIDTAQVSGDALMRGPDDRPLLVLDRVEDGRVAMVLSDQTWLWARGVDGGGPHAELFRRLAHWLMGEPDLEEERLIAETGNGVLTIERRTMGDGLDPVIVSSPSGEEFEVPLSEVSEGVWRGETDIDEIGLYRVRSEELTSVAAAGPLNPRELGDMSPTEEALKPFIDATGGGSFFIGEGGGANVPEIRRTRVDADQAGLRWMGLKRNEAYASMNEQRNPLAPALLAVAIALMALTGAWAREGR